MIALSRIWKVYFIYTILLVVGVALAGFVMEAQVKKSLTEHTRENVLTLTRVMAKSLPDTKVPSVLAEFCRSFGKVAGARITLIDQDGKVIGESHTDIAGAEAKLDRPEVQEAIQTGEGSSIRFSKTLRIDMLYTALFLKEKGKIIRLAVPMNMVRVFQNDVMILFSLGLFLTPIFAILVMFLFVKSAITDEKRRLSRQLQNQGNMAGSTWHDD